MARYFLPDNKDPLSESVCGLMFWYVPIPIAHICSITSPTVHDSQGNHMTGDDFWNMAGDLDWVECR